MPIAGNELCANALMAKQTKKIEMKTLTFQKYQKQIARCLLNSVGYLKSLRYSEFSHFRNDYSVSLPLDEKGEIKEKLSCGSH